MTEESTHQHADEPAESGAEAPSGTGETESAEGREWLAQLQHMIDRIAAGAAPVTRDVAAKAAELTAVAREKATPVARDVAARAAELTAAAGDKAGPIAARAAEVTGDVGTRVAERSRRLAEDLRHHEAEGDQPSGESPDAPDAAAPADAPADEKPEG